MAENKETSATIDSILKLLVVGSVLSAGLVAPNLLRALDKPTSRFFDKMDRRSRERELKRILYYMQRQKLISPRTKGYDHGLKITSKGKQRLASTNKQINFIPKPEKWDKKWRLVFYDIPEEKRKARVALTRKLNQLGFYQLQRSVWVYPYACRDEIMDISSGFDVNRYISYIETNHIDQQRLLINKFKSIM